MRIVLSLQPVQHLQSLYTILQGQIASAAGGHLAVSYGRAEELQWPEAQTSNNVHSYIMCKGRDPKEVSFTEKVKSWELCDRQRSPT